MRNTLLLHLPFLASEQGCGQLSDLPMSLRLGNLSTFVLAFRVLLAESIPLPTTTNPTEGQGG